MNAVWRREREKKPDPELFFAKNVLARLGELVKQQQQQPCKPFWHAHVWELKIDLVVVVVEQSRPCQSSSFHSKV